VQYRSGMVFYFSASRISHGDIRRDFQYGETIPHLLADIGTIMRFAIRGFPILKVLPRLLGYQ